LEKYFNEKFKNEFDYLCNVIDEDKYHKVGLLPKNELCRYSDIRPYEYNNVEIDSDKKFINASWIHLPHYFYFIASQGPIEKTIEDFLSMCIKYEVQLIVMLCNVEEEGKEKCAKYWDRKFENYEVSKRVETTVITQGILLRRLTIKKEKEKLEKDIDQIQFTCWDDHEGLNYEYFEKIIKIINYVDMYKKDNPNSPIIIHCSAGVGRTGTFICLYMIYKELYEQMVNKSTSEIKFSIMNLVRKIKEMRIYSVENEDQYIMLYMFANYLLLNYNI
jgi:protein tyrosine phosphatase